MQEAWDTWELCILAPYGWTVQRLVWQHASKFEGISYILMWITRLIKSVHYFCIIHAIFICLSISSNHFVTHSVNHNQPSNRDLPVLSTLPTARFSIPLFLPPSHIRTSGIFPLWVFENFVFIDLQFNIQDAQISILASATGVYISWQSTYVVKVEGSAQNPISRHLSRPCRQFWGPLLVIFDVAGIEQLSKCRHRC